MKDRQRRMLKLLQDAVEALEQCDCQFQFCPGPSYAVRLSMKTCNRCWTLRQARRFLEAAK